MKLVIGGAYQGKREFLMQRWGLCDREIADASACRYSDIRAIVNYQNLIRQQMEQGLDPADELRQLAGRDSEIILCADEIGMGIVPMDRKERDFRESCGRTLCLAAQMADEVWRVICGIGEKIK